MRIAFWHYYTFRLHRGIETLTLSLSNALVRKNIDVTVLSASRRIQPLVELDPRVRVAAYPTFRYFSHTCIAPFYFNHFLWNQYDYVVVFFADFGESATLRLLKYFRDIPLILFLCYPKSAAEHRYRSFVALNWHRSAKKVLADAKWIADDAGSLFERDVKTVPVGTDPQRFKPDAQTRLLMRKNFGFSDDDVVLLNVSSLEQRKGVARAIHAVARVRKVDPRIHYLVLGHGPDEEELKKLAQTLGISKSVHFAGETHQLEGYYAMSDIFLMLPDHEGNSVACHEAMSSSLPVIVSDHPGFREDVTEESGILVNVESDGDIDRSILDLAANPERRRSLGEAGRRQILTHRTWDHSADVFLAALNQHERSLSHVR